eukprot:TRINITY_DN23412_c0_g1_i1.p1 TRINITY_DN23412_c0_g1~~TRINITY_DN23412_c0_g1_i1.p1  ORF type:complete len:1394 (+),score=447.74 TRINITY_DN23412_c0_g1_i1:574-4182(+)
MHIACDAPSPKLSGWDGILTSETLDFTTPVDLNNLLLRGCIVRQTPTVYGLVIYTGVKTKMSLNLTPPPVKRSRIDQKLSRLIQYILVAQQCCILLLCAGSLVFAKASSQSDAFYIAYYNHDMHAVVFFIKHYLTYFVLLALMMPISLFLSIEFCKLLQAKFMEWDLQMYDAERDLAMKAKTASLNEELSQVQTICTDKTGTLTDNRMVFANAFVCGTSFDELGNAGSMVAALTSGNYFRSHLFCALRDGVRFSVEKQVHHHYTHMLLQSMAICNTIIPSHDGLDGFNFAGDSTDEVALAKAAQSNGYTLCRRTETEIHLRVGQTPPPGGRRTRGQSRGSATPSPGKRGSVASSADGSCADGGVAELAIPLLCTLPFSSDRKMMSVVVQHPTHGLALLTKGSDAAVLARCVQNDPGDTDLRDKTERALDDYACSGLRTLCFAWKPLTEAGFAAWKKNVWDVAATSLHNKQAAIDRACLELEANLTLVGATGIEDKLQHGVPETIAFFRAAGVVLWVLTGDKKETAVNIARSSNVITDATEVICLDVAGWRSGKLSPANPSTPTTLSPASPTPAEKERVFGEKAAFMQGELAAVIRQVESCRGIPDPYGSPPYCPGGGSNDMSSYNSFGSMMNFSMNNGANHPLKGKSKRPSFRKSNSSAGKANSTTGDGGDPPPLGAEQQRTAAAKTEICLLVDGLTLEVVFQDEACKDLFTSLSRMVGCALCCRVTPMQKADVVGVLQGQGLTCLGIGDGANDVSMIQRARVGVGIMGLEGSQAERSSDYAVPKFHHLVPLLAVHGRYALLKNSYLIQYSFYKNLVYSLCQIAYSAFAGFTGQTLFDSWVIINYNMIFTLLPPLVMGLYEYDVDSSELRKYPQLYYDLRSSRGGRLSRESIIRWLVWSVVHSGVIFGFLFPMMQNDDSTYRSSGIWTAGTYVMAAAITMVTAKAGLCFMSWTWLHFASLVLSLLLYHLFVIIYSSIPSFFGHRSYYGVASVVYADPKFYLWVVGITTLLVVLELSVVYWAKEVDPRLVDLVRESLQLRRDALREGRGRSFFGFSNSDDDDSPSLSPGSITMAFSTREASDERAQPLLDRTANQGSPQGSHLSAAPSPSMLPSRRQESGGLHLQPLSPLLTREAGSLSAKTSSPLPTSPLVPRHTSFSPLLGDNDLCYKPSASSSPLCQSLLSCHNLNGTATPSLKSNPVIL